MPATKTGPAWGGLVPVRTVAWEEVDGLVQLLVPRFGSGRLGLWLQRSLRQRPLRVHLDAMGSFVWNRCDGRSRVDEIGRALQAEFGERATSVEDRLVEFLRSLVRGGFVTLYTSPPGRPDAGTTGKQSVTPDS
jgi:hypothetical protein